MLKSNKRKIITFTLSVTLASCSSNKALNCQLIPISKGCHHNTDALSVQNDVMKKKCRNANYELNIAKQAGNKADISKNKLLVKNHCIDSERSK